MNRFIRGCEFILVVGLLTAGGAKAGVVKCVERAGDGNVYVTSSDHLVNFQFLPRRGYILPPRLDYLFVDLLNIIPQKLHAHFFEMDMPRKSCDIDPGGITFRCRRSELLDSVIPVPINDKNQLMAFSMVPVRSAEVELKEFLNSVGTIEHQMDLTFLTSDITGGISLSLECVN